MFEKLEGEKSVGFGWGPWGLSGKDLRTVLDGACAIVVHIPIEQACLVWVYNKTALI